MTDHEVVSREQWTDARLKLLAREKELTRARDEVSQLRRDMPWVRVDKEYLFHGPDGKETLADLFAGRSQLLVYHFMFDTDWKEGCKSCSFWADNYNGLSIHLAHRDATMVTVSRAPLNTLEEFKRRMGWDFKWVSSYESDFNRDFNVSFTPEELENKVWYNYTMQRFGATEAPGASAFYRDQNGVVYHTYSCFSRGLDMLNGAYHWMDLLPKGRDEDDLSYTMEWLRLHDRYDDAS